MEGVDEAGGLWILCHSGQCSRHVQGRGMGGGGELEGGGARVGGGVEGQLVRMGQKHVCILFWPALAELSETDVIACTQHSPHRKRCLRFRTREID